MRYVKLFLMVLFTFVLLSGCQKQMDVPEDENSRVPKEQLEHIGCQEGEIDKDGKCLPAQDNNAGLFGQDFTETILSMEVNENIKGYLAKPKDDKNYPGVIMIHEWWGLNDNVKEMAQILANEGYIVFAVDLYNGEVAATSDEARALATSVRENSQTAVATMQQVVAYLTDQYKVETFASLGWCFGGQQSLNLSLNEGMDATVIYYGHLVDDKQQLKNLKGPVLGIFGAEDGSISVESVRTFETSLNELGINNAIHIYPDVGHAFANPSGSNYAEEETLDAWKKTLDFLNENLKG